MLLFLPCLLAYFFSTTKKCSIFIWVVVSNSFYVYPYLGKGKNPLFDFYFSQGLKPPTTVDIFYIQGNFGGPLSTYWEGLDFKQIKFCSLIFAFFHLFVQWFFPLSLSLSCSSFLFKHHLDMVHFVLIGKIKEKHVVFR